MIHAMIHDCPLHRVHKVTQRVEKRGNTRTHAHTTLHHVPLLSPQSQVLRTLPSRAPSTHHIPIPSNLHYLPICHHRLNQPPLIVLVLSPIHPPSSSSSSSSSSSFFSFFQFATATRAYLLLCPRAWTSGWTRLQGRSATGWTGWRCGPHPRAAPTQITRCTRRTRCWSPFPSECSRRPRRRPRSPSILRFRTGSRRLFRGSVSAI